ncbi:MAG: signal peptidase I [Ruminococcaceae bacterium]|nr:signal peptidase I [Oscillospiraceae bacterium]
MSNKNTVKNNSFAAEIFEWLEMIILSACTVLLIFTFIARPANVDGASMEDTLHDKEMLVISDLFYEPKQGDIIVFQKINSVHPAPIVKRVIATEGETIDINFDTWTVTVTDIEGNKRVLDESKYRKLLPDRRVTSNLEYPITLGENELFVMGDNRNNSLDSRDSRIGIVNEKEIIGRVCLRAFPLNKFGTVN